MMLCQGRLLGFVLKNEVMRAVHPAGPVLTRGSRLVIANRVDDRFRANSVVDEWTEAKAQSRFLVHSDQGS